MNIENLREEIFGEKGYARWLKTKWISGEQLARRAQERVQSEMGTTVDCNSVNTYLSRLLDVEYEIYLSAFALDFQLLASQLLQPCNHSFPQRLHTRIKTTRQ